MSSELRAAQGSRADGGPSEHTIETACTLVADTANGITSVKVGLVALDAALDRLSRSIAERPGVRLVLRVRPSTAEADLVIEQAITPLFNQPRQAADCDGLLSHFLPRSWSKPHAHHSISHVDGDASTMKELP